MAHRAAEIRILATADTHVPDFAQRLPDALLREAERADLILHAGDVTGASVLEQLSELASVRAVRGNNDGPDIAQWGACESLECEVGGISIALIHDAGPAKGRPARMRRRFPAARLVIYGHSHIPMVLEEDGLWLVNPGSPTWKRRQPRPTYAVVTLSTTIDVQLVQL